MKVRAWVVAPLLILLPQFGPAHQPGRSASGVGNVGMFLLGPVAYGGPSLDEALDASDQALRVAQEAAEAEQARLAQEAAERAQTAAQAAIRVPNPVTPPGGHTDLWWSGVSTCEQGGQNHPYFGYFSFMDGSQGGRPWAEQVAAGNALLIAVGHEIGPWAESCVRAGYAASPSG